uniref:THAP-type domain-containing protein n=1 Tax=Timema poppense TaxID=170557 RepID=A0A7R9D8U8_TIMPO|nr:unnamed protein product [Timema poppensis]
MEKETTCLEIGSEGGGRGGVGSQEDMRVAHIHDECVDEIVAIVGEGCRPHVPAVDGDVDGVPHVTKTHPASTQLGEIHREGEAGWRRTNKRREVSRALVGETARLGTIESARKLYSWNWKLLRSNSVFVYCGRGNQHERGVEFCLASVRVVLPSVKSVVRCELRSAPFSKAAHSSRRAVPGLNPVSFKSFGYFCEKQDAGLKRVAYLAPSWARLCDVWDLIDFTVDRRDMLSTPITRYYKDLIDTLVVDVCDTLTESTDFIDLEQPTVETHIKNLDLISATYYTRQVVVPTCLEQEPTCLEHGKRGQEEGVIRGGGKPATNQRARRRCHVTKFNLSQAVSIGREHYLWIPMPTGVGYFLGCVDVNGAYFHHVVLRYIKQRYGLSVAYVNGDGAIQKLPSSRVSQQRFPSYETRYREWIQLIDISLSNIPFDQLREYRICAYHFTEGQFMNIHKNKLIHSAVPSILLPARQQNFGRSLIPDPKEQISETQHADLRKPVPSNLEHSSTSPTMMFHQQQLHWHVEA